MSLEENIKKWVVLDNQQKKLNDQQRIRLNQQGQMISP